MNYPMMKPRRLTVDEFRELEAQSPEDERWELINGVIYKSMAGGTRAHNIIVQNVASSLMTMLRASKSPCRPFTENMRLDIAAAELSTLPDVVVSCSLMTDGTKAISDAQAVVEVLSPTTSGRDRSEKLDAYLTIPSLRTLALVEQEAMQVVTYTRTDSGWLRREFTKPDDRLAFEGLDVSLALADVYEDIAFNQMRK